MELFEDNGSAYDICVKEYKTGNVIFETTGVRQNNIKFSLNGVTLWDTKNPFLYMLELRFKGEEQSLRFGIRKIETRGG